MSPFKLLCATGLLAIFSSTISKSPALPLFAQYLGADSAGVGIIASVSALTGVLVSIPAGILSDRWGRKRLLMISSVVFATAPLLYLFVNNAGQLVLVRLYHGLATAIFLPVGMALVSDLFHKERGEKIGWFSTATLFGRFIAPFAGGAVIASFAYNPVAGFRAVYVVCGLAGLAVFIFSLRIHDGAATPAGIGRSWSETFRTFKDVISDRAIVMTALVEAAILFAYGTFETFLPLYAVKAGHTAYEVGIFLSGQVITLALFKPVMGRLSDRRGRRPQIIFGALAGAAGMAGFSVADGFVSLLSLSVVFGLFQSIVTSATAAFIADLSKSENRGSAMGVLGSVMDIGHTTGPLAAGFAASWFGFGAAFIGAAVVLASASIAFLSFGKRRKNISPVPMR